MTQGWDEKTPSSVHDGHAPRFCADSSTGNRNSRGRGALESYPSSVDSWGWEQAGSKEPDD